MSEATAEHSSEPRKLRILLADDSRIIRVAVRRILADTVDLIEAQDGEEAWQILSETSDIDVLLTDIGMPKLDGYELIERLRDPQNPRHLRTLPIIVLSGNDEPEEKERALNSGASDYITKPFDTQQITGRVEALAREAARHRDALNAPGSASDPGAIDPKTRLVNRALFEQQADKDIAFAKRHGKEMTLLLIRVDQPEALIEQHGARLIDQLMRKLGEFIVGCVRRLETVGHVGTHEFGILAPMTNDLGGITVANRILTRIRSVRFNTAKGPLRFTISLGLAAPAIYTLGDVSDLLEIAQRRLNVAMEAGGDRVICDDRPLIAEGQSPDEPHPKEAVQPEAAPPLAELPPGLDITLWMVADGKGERLAGNRRALLQRLLPLLDAIDDRDELDLSEILPKLHELLA